MYLAQATNKASEALSWMDKVDPNLLLAVVLVALLVIGVLITAALLMLRNWGSKVTDGIKNGLTGAIQSNEFRDATKEGLRDGLSGAIGSGLRSFATSVLTKEHAQTLTQNLLTITQHAANRAEPVSSGHSHGYIYERRYRTRDRGCLLDYFILTLRSRTYKRELESPGAKTTATVENWLLAKRHELMERIKKNAPTELDDTLALADALMCMHEHQVALDLLQERLNGAHLEVRWKQELLFRMAVIHKEAFESGQNGIQARSTQLMPHIDKAIEISDEFLAHAQSAGDVLRYDERVHCLRGYCFQMQARRRRSARDPQAGKESEALFKRALASFREAEKCLTQRRASPDWGLEFTLMNNIADVLLDLGEYEDSLSKTEGFKEYGLAQANYFILDTRATALTRCLTQTNRFVTRDDQEWAAREANTLFAEALGLRSHPEIRAHREELEAWCEAHQISMTNRPVTQPTGLRREE